ncbi:MAG: DUF3516 domain-containing protein, partial [Stackebrandtia sp.]
MKADGIEYDERVERVAEITHPKPLEELLEAAYDTYGGTHPWIRDYPLRPKTVARDLYERAMTFGEYIAFYDLSRAEGIVLRYLASAYKALDQTIPEDAKTEEIFDLAAWLGEVVRQVDSSLLDEWQQLSNPEDEEKTIVPVEASTAITANTRAFTVSVRNALFRHVELAALDRPAELAALDTGLSAEQWEEALDAYYDAHDDIGTGADARSTAMLLIDKQPVVWRVSQILDDPDGDHDWRINADVDLAASDEAGEVVLVVAGLAPMVGA